MLYGAKPLLAAVDVLVVGGGPTGLTAASLLTTYGLSVALIEKNQTTSDEAKAISLDDESLRTLQAAGLDEAVRPIFVPGTGTRYYAANGKSLFHARGPKVLRHGHPFKNPFAQPDLERAMLEELRSRENVALCFGHEFVELTQETDSVSATVRDTLGRTATVQAQFVLGCDGGQSTVRKQLGIDMTGRSFPELWLVADTVEDTHDERYGMHVGDPKRPHVIVPGLHGRCRYEFKLEPGEATAGTNPPFELVQRLVARYRTLTPEQLERSVVYGFHAIIADALRAHRCFLLGDAAHMMPPFAGQGLNSGVRDAMNLSWKVASVVNGHANLHLLSTYESERRLNAQATIDLSVRLGEVVMTSSRRRALLRDPADSWRYAHATNAPVLDRDAVQARSGARDGLPSKRERRPRRIASRNLHPSNPGPRRKHERRPSARRCPRVGWRSRRRWRGPVELESARQVAFRPGQRGGRDGRRRVREARDNRR